MFVKKPGGLELEDIEKLKEINSKIAAVVPNESTKIQIEILYFDLLEVLRSNGFSAESESTVAKFKLLYETMQLGINVKRRTTRNAVSAIKTFRNSLRILLRDLIQNGVEKIKE